MAEENHAKTGTFRESTSLLSISGNSRRYPKRLISIIADSLKEQGFTIPILIDERDRIIVGHIRVAAANQVERTGKSVRCFDGSLIPAGCVPVLIATGWTMAEKEAYTVVERRLLKQEEDEYICAELNQVLVGLKLES